MNWKWNTIELKYFNWISCYGKIENQKRAIIQLHMYQMQQIINSSEWNDFIEMAQNQIK